MSIENSDRTELTYNDLIRQNQALNHEVEQLRQQSVYAWGLYAETSRKLQVYSASIKAAVSSLLNHDIFWDSANQYEFLTNINASVSQVSELTILLTLAFRANAGSLTLKRDPQMIQEILSVAQANARLKLPELALKISYPVNGKMALVDYDYFTKALLLLIEVYNSSKPSGQILITASEGDTLWFLDISGIDIALMKTIEQMSNSNLQPVGPNSLSAESIIRLNIACGVLQLQEITMEILERSDQPAVLRIKVPAVANS
jgi:K+-sensing histidine kinase KdpD